MDERDFKLLAVLKETKNITRAADLLFATQSSLSKRISGIEQELGTTLILRSRQGIVFTPEGEEVLERTAKAAEQLQLMRDTIDTRRPYICGTLHAGISVNYVLYRFPDVLAAYRKAFPHVNTHINSDHSRKVYAQLMDGEIDVAIVRGEYQWKGHKDLIEQENICLIYHEQYQGQPLSEIPYIGRKTDAVFEREIVQWLREHELSPELHGIYVDSITTCAEMVSRGLGWTIVPEICLQNFDGMIQPLSFENGTPFVRSTYLMYSETAYELPQVKAFIEIVKNSKDKVI